MAKVILFPLQVHHTSSTAAEPLVDKVLTETLELAQRRVPVRASTRPFDRRTTGRLKRSLKKRGPFIKVTKVDGTVGSRLPYASSIEDGAKAHTFGPRFQPDLVFYWEREDVTFVGKRVNHPGVRQPSHFLWDSLRAAAFANGFKTRRLPAKVA